jgi:hypothetical protein
MCRTITKLTVCTCCTHLAAVTRTTSLAESADPHVLLAEMLTGTTREGTSRCDHQSDLSRWTEANARLIPSDTLVYMIDFVGSRAEIAHARVGCRGGYALNRRCPRGSIHHTRCRTRRDNASRVSTETNAKSLETCVQLELENELNTLSAAAQLVLFVS